MTTVPRGSLLPHFLIDFVGEADGVRLGQCLEARGDIHAVAQHIAVGLHHDITEVDADADMNLLAVFFLRIVSRNWV